MLNGILDLASREWFGALLGLAGVAFGAYQTLRHAGPRLAYQYLGQRLIEGGGGLLLPREVVVQYSGRPVPRVSITHLVIWNAGRAAIRGAEIVSADPIRFRFEPESEILKAEVVKATRPVNESKVTTDPEDHSRLTFTFSFLDRQDGALVKILHSAEKIRPQCTGTIVGLPKGVESWGRLPLGLSRTLPPEGPFFMPYRMLDLMTANFRIIAAVMALFGTMLILVALAPDVASPAIGEPSTFVRMLMLIIGAIYGPISFLAAFTSRRRCPRSLLPDDTVEGA